MDNGKYEAKLLDLLEEENFGTALEVLSECDVSVDVETNVREYSNGPAQAMSKLTFTIDLSKSRMPWQPHMDQPWAMAEVLARAVKNEYQEFLENMEDGE